MYSLSKTRKKERGRYDSRVIVISPRINYLHFARVRAISKDDSACTLSRSLARQGRVEARTLGNDRPKVSMFISPNGERRAETKEEEEN